MLTSHFEPREDAVEVRGDVAACRDRLTTRLRSVLVTSTGGVGEVVQHVGVHVRAIRPHQRLALRIDSHSCEQAAVADQRLEHRASEIGAEVDFT